MSKARRTLRFHRIAAAAAFGALALGLAAPGQSRSQPLGAPSGGENCAVGMAAAAQQNLIGARTLAFTPFGRPETGWEIYAPLTGREIGTRCGFGSPAFARDLAAWEAAHGLGRSGVMDAVTFAAMKAVWQRRRPFVEFSRRGCPAASDETSLASVPASQSYGGKAMLMRQGALAAYGRMLAAARNETPQVRADRRLLTIFSAYRSPDYDAARCAREGNCQGITRATCSAHRTGLAIDLYLGAAPGFGPDSSDDANRLAISRGAAYRWMVANAARFGFVNYPFEPWHWEWTGEPI
jgi:D-alanyl-D-alanine carboxypeptidase